MTRIWHKAMRASARFLMVAARSGFDSTMRPRQERSHDNDNKCAGEVGLPRFRLLAEKSDSGAYHQSGRRRRQHFLSLRPEPHGQRSLRPSFSTSSFST
jgi:hypothetical protein